MPEHFLNDAKVCTASQKVRCEGMAELMGMHGFLDPGDLCIVADQLPDTRRGERVATHREEDLSA